MAKNLKGHDLEFAESQDAGGQKIQKGSFDLCFIDLMLDGKDARTG